MDLIFANTREQFYEVALNGYTGVEKYLPIYRATAEAPLHEWLFYTTHCPYAVFNLDIVLDENAVVRNISREEETPFLIFLFDISIIPFISADNLSLLWLDDELIDQSIFEIFGQKTGFF